MVARAVFVVVKSLPLKSRSYGCTDCVSMCVRVPSPKTVVLQLQYTRNPGAFKFRILARLSIRQPLKFSTFTDCSSSRPTREFNSTSGKRDVPVLHTGLISCSTGTSIPPEVENPGSTSVVESRD
jgi:hypothetical protein